MTFRRKRPGRIGGYLLRTDEAYDFTGLSPPSFRRYRDLLGIRPRKIYRQKGKWYLFSDLLMIIEVYAPPEDRYVKHLGKRLDYFFREMEEGQGRR